jgi:hypothetical protein
MHRPLLLSALSALVVLTAGIVMTSRTEAQSGTPAAGAAMPGAMTLILVEHNEHHSILDLGETGAGPGDLRVWGPNPLYDETNTTDTGAVTAGSCAALDAIFNCVVVETITFPDGSTLQFQGGAESSGPPAPFHRTIVGGSGQYLGTVGTAVVVPNDDETLFTRTFEVVVP